MLISNITNKDQSPTNFQKFLKVKGHTHQLNDIKSNIQREMPDTITFIKKEPHRKNLLYILTGKHADKFLDLMNRELFMELRTKPEKYMKEKANKVKQSDIYKKLGLTSFSSQ